MTASAALDGSKFKAVNTRDKNFTRGKVERRRAQLETSVARYLGQLDTADLREPSEELVAKAMQWIIVGMLIGILWAGDRAASPQPE
jgi:hypothetical protein